jgi:hypothetical protein
MKTVLRIVKYLDPPLPSLLLPLCFRLARPFPLPSATRRQDEHGNSGTQHRTHPFPQAHSWVSLHGHALPLATALDVRWPVKFLRRVPAEARHGRGAPAKPQPQGVCSPAASG